MGRSGTGTVLSWLCVRTHGGYVKGLSGALNRESGFGRYDVMIYPKRQNGLDADNNAGSKRDAFILEFKVHDPESKKELRETAQEALEQIEEKNYVAELEAIGFAKENIRKYGFAFEGKKVLIGTEQEGYF